MHKFILLYIFFILFLLFFKKIYKYIRIDGNLFVNLNEPEYADMGITNKFHLRKLQIIMKAYKRRYKQKKSKRVIDEEEDLGSEYSPSELSDIIAHEGLENEEGEDDDVRTVHMTTYILLLESSSFFLNLYIYF